MLRVGLLTIYYDSILCGVFDASMVIAQVFVSPFVNCVDFIVSHSPSHRARARILMLTQIIVVPGDRRAIIFVWKLVPLHIRVVQIFLLLMHARSDIMDSPFEISITVIVLHVFWSGSTPSITVNSTAINFTRELQLALVSRLLNSGLGTDCWEGGLVLDLVHYKQGDGPLAGVFVPGWSLSKLVLIAVIKHDLD